MNSIPIRYDAEYYDDRPSGRCVLIASETRKARKEHQCSLCSDPIRPGDTYIREFAIYDDEPTWQAMHGDCRYGGYPY